MYSSYCNICKRAIKNCEGLKYRRVLKDGELSNKEHDAHENCFENNPPNYAARVVSRYYVGRVGVVVEEGKDG